MSFVSVTQQFNMTTSMGRLTLNVLLSFAQFEREVTSERIRDKIAASKRKGLSALLQGAAERAGSVRRVPAAEIDALVTKSVRDCLELPEPIDDPVLVARHIAGVEVQWERLVVDLVDCKEMLQNRIYRGEIVHKGKSYPGEHEPIVDEALWTNVQAILSKNRVDRAKGTTGREPNLLIGILFDAHGGRMSPTHANKKGTRYRYYISRSLLEGSAKAKTEGQRIPAAALESLVVRRLRDWLTHPAAILQAAQHAASDAATQMRLVERARHFAAGEHELGAQGLRTFMRSSIERVQVHVDRIDITSDQDRVFRCLDETGESEPIDKTQSEVNHQVTMLSIPARLKQLAGRHVGFMEDRPEIVL